LPPYNANPGVNTFPVLLQPGVNGYAFGSLNVNFPTTMMEISAVTLIGNVAGVSVLVREGAIPIPGSLLTIRGTSTASGAFNVVNVPIGTVTIDPVTGIGTITFTIVHADVAPVADTGQAYVPVPEVGELLPAPGLTQASQAFAIQDIAGHNENGLTIQWSTSYPAQPSTVLMTLQVADVDQDSQYQMLDSSNNTNGDSRSITLTRFRFLRVLASGVTGGASPTAIVRIGI
jgi:hypothetical protein